MEFLGNDSFDMISSTDSFRYDYRSWTTAHVPDTAVAWLGLGPFKTPVVGKNYSNVLGDTCIWNWIPRCLGGQT